MIGNTLDDYRSEFVCGFANTRTPISQGEWLICCMQVYFLSSIPNQKHVVYEFVGDSFHCVPPGQIGGH